MNINVTENKRYIKYSLKDDPSSILDGYLNDIVVSDGVLERLSKDLGVSRSIYEALKLVENNPLNIVSYMSLKNKHPEVYLLEDIDEKVIIGYSLDGERAPILNSEFIKRVTSLSETSDDIEISEVYYSKEDTTSTVILKKKDPITVEEKYGEESKYYDYNIGVLIVNDETSTSYTRLVVYLDGQPLYLPASYYNTSLSRYRRSTASSVEALEVLILKVITDLREDYLSSKLKEFHYRYRANKNIVTTYEEYNTLLRTMRKIPTVIEDNSYITPLLDRYEIFERNYSSSIEDQKSSYLWRCTAVSDDTSIGTIVHIVSSILSDMRAPSLEYFNIRELLGSYVSTTRIVEEIAKEDNL